MVMDENFLMKKDRGMELLALMEEHKKAWSFVLFCSANIVKQLGVDFFVRMGISRVWIGVESKINTHDKVKGIDLKQMISELQEHGIIVLASTILFQDHHDRNTIIDEIDWVNSLDSDLVQFMNYTPWPTTALHEKLESEGRMKNVPYRNQHGAGELLFEHPHFKNALDHERYLYNAFRKKYRTGGPAIANMALTAVKGYIRAENDNIERVKNGLKWDNGILRYEKCGDYSMDRYMNLRIEVMRKEALRYRPVLYPAMIFSPNHIVRKKVYRIIRLYHETFGAPGIRDMMKSFILVFTAGIEALRISIAKIRGREGIIRQPATHRLEFKKS